MTVAQKLYSTDKWILWSGTVIRCIMYTEWLCWQNIKQGIWPLLSPRMKLSEMWGMSKMQFVIIMLTLKTSWKKAFGMKCFQCHEQNFDVQWTVYISVTF